DRFDVDAGGTARLEARWGLTGSDHEAGVDLHYTRLEQAVEGEGYDAIAAALSATVADLAREIAGAIRQAHGG
ncbi:MAG: ABC-type transport auxiliary lipoprotein family protein, partial [Planctomycetota bacterium]|nr:ABC-type transport auxiliary lipoprotein family protein [Planctomycetota bacterium]